MEYNNLNIGYLTVGTLNLLTDNSITLKTSVTIQHGYNC